MWYRLAMTPGNGFTCFVLLGSRNMFVQVICFHFNASGDSPWSRECECNHSNLRSLRTSNAHTVFICLSSQRGPQVRLQLPRPVSISVSISDQCRFQNRCAEENRYENDSPCRELWLFHILHCFHHRLWTLVTVAMIAEGWRHAYTRVRRADEVSTEFLVTISWGHVIMWGGTTRKDCLVARAALNSGELCSCFELGSILLILIDITHVYRFIFLTYYQYRMVTTSSITTRWREKRDMRNVDVTALLIFLLPPCLIFLLYYFIFIQMSFCLYLLQFCVEI